MLVKRPVIPSYPYRSSYECGQIEGVSAESPRNARLREGVAAAFGTPGLRVRPMNFYCGRPAGLVNPVPGSPSSQTPMASKTHPRPLPQATSEVEPGYWHIVLHGEIAKLATVVLSVLCVLAWPAS